MSKAISPDQVAALKAVSFPPYVFDAFNELIAADYTNGSATVVQKKVIELILEKANPSGSLMSTLTKEAIFAKGYLNVEEVYREAGWKVKYDKPGWNEDYEASFEFRKK